MAERMPSDQCCPASSRAVPDQFQVYDTMQRMRRLLDAGLLRVVHEEGRDAIAYQIDHMPDGEVVIWIE